MSASITSQSVDGLELALERLLEDYRELQQPRPTIIPSPPSSLEALRMLSASHPAVIYRCTPQTPSSASAGYDWHSADTYKRILGNGQITIAITDDGLADSVRGLSDGRTSFVKPLEEKMSVSDFFDGLCDPERPEVMYLQSQDGNVFRSEAREGGDELSGMRQHLERDVEWMKEAAGESAEAVNLWIGSSRSVTSLHHDPYENIYHVLSGTKTFTLISPIEGLWLSQHFHPTSTLHRSKSNPSDLIPILDPPPTYPVPWVESDVFPSPIEPIIITLQEGETLYLPRGWWHRVEQTEGPGGLAVAVNYWYNYHIDPSSNALFRLAQRIARQAGRLGVLPVDVEDSDSGDDGGIRDGVWGEEGDSGSGEEWEPSEWGR